MKRWSRTVAAVLVLGSVSLAAVVLAADAAKPARTAAEKAALIERGRTLVGIMGCNDCHTPGGLYAQPDAKRELAGSEIGWKGPWGVSFARNLTPDLETGMGYWTEDEIVRAFKTGNKNDGTQMLPPMPWLTTAKLTDADQHALALYLMSLPAISHHVPDALPPGKDYAGPTVVIPAPGAWDAPAGAK